MRPLAANACEIWIADIDSPLVDATPLSEAERARASRFRFDRDRIRFVNCRAILRRLLALYTGAAPEAVEIAEGPRKKPFLARGGIEFNVTHSGSRALLGFTRSTPLGVDLEKLRPVPDHESLAARFFSPLERDLLRGIDPALRERSFLRCWTRKEAFVKALGDGLHHPLDAFDVELRPDWPARFLGIRGDAAGVSGWSLHDLDVGPGFAGAAAFRGQLDVMMMTFSK